MQHAPRRRKGKSKLMDRSWTPPSRSDFFIMINITIRIPKKLEKEEVNVKIQPAKKFQKKIRMEIK
jgi:hypothetical protein